MLGLGYPKPTFSSAMCRWVLASSFLSQLFSSSIFGNGCECREMPRRVQQRSVSVRAKQLKNFRPVLVELRIGGHQKQGARVSFVLVTSSRSRRELQQSDRGVASKSAAIGPQADI